MKRCFALAILSVVLSGCKMKEFASTPFYAGDEVKYTGRVEDRVNLWPLAYWREPFGSVLWPLVSFGEGHFAMFPFWSHERDGEFEQKKNLFGQELMAGCSKFKVRNNHTWLLAFDSKDVIRSSGPIAGTNEIIHSVEYAPWILCRTSSQRFMKFDVATHEKVYDNETRGISGLACLIYQYRSSKDFIGNNGTKVRHQALLNMWDWEETNGNVSLDVFPGFTYDSKTNGYTKVSLFWRLFRYENDPVAGREADLLFVPVWR